VSKASRQADENIARLVLNEREQWPGMVSLFASGTGAGSLAGPARDRMARSSRARFDRRQREPRIENALMEQETR